MMWGSALLGLATLAGTAAATEGGIPRYPDIHGDQIVFTAGGDLWTVGTAGGTARRLTTHEGLERYARFSPNGQWVAYTAQYEGDGDVWVVPAAGGTPRRLTWHTMGGGDDFVWDWTADGRSILFSSRLQAPGSRHMELFTVSIDGGLPEPLPTSDAGPATFAPDGSLVFNRKFRNFRTWKRYTGGMQQDLWRFDPATGSSERLTEFEGTDTHPMVAADGTIYFVSDRTADGGFGRRNLFRYAEGDASEQLTNHTDFDVDWSALWENTIVYMHGGDLRLLDLSSGEDRLLELVIPDEALETRRRLVSVDGDVTSLTVGPQAHRVAVVAHGDLFTVAAKEGPWRLVVGGAEGRINEASWSPDGRQLAYISDRSGEQQVWLVDQAGEGEPRKLSDDNDTWISGLRWSHDGERLLYTDKRMRLWDVDAATGQRNLVDTGTVGEISQASYSRDGSWITYVKADDNGLGSIWLHPVGSGEVHRVTDAFNDDFAPAWDPSGNYLFFASRRNFDLVSNVFEFRLVHRMTDLLYVVRLREDVADLLAPDSDEEVEPSGEPNFEETEDDKKEKRRKKREERRRKKRVVLDAPKLVVDLDGISRRLQRLPVEAGRYAGLEASEDHLFYMSMDALDEDPPELRAFVLEDQEDKKVLAGVYGFELAASQEKALAATASGYLIIDAKPDAGSGEDVTISGLTTWVDPTELWRQTLDEARRYMREHFYDPGMHGHDWDGIHDRYAALLPRATSVSDVVWLIGEMIGELNVGHAYVNGPYTWRRQHWSGFLGADLEADDVGAVRFARIYEGEPGDPRRSSPLRAPGVDVEAGEYLLAVNGVSLEVGTSPYELLMGTVGRPTILTVGPRADGVGSREVIVEPIRSEAQLRYWDWVEDNRRRVLTATDGRAGYMHLPNTSTAGYTEFVRALYAQSDKDALVIDVRFNGGGFIPEMFIEHLLRPHYNTWVPRDGADWRTPNVAVHGPKVVIANGYAGSGGDAFPYYFRQFGLGKVVGERTWGGLVGIDNQLPLLIGGALSAPSFGFVNAEGEWDVERVGVAPDLPVVDPPEARRSGEDPQLEAAIGVILEELETWVDPVPPRPERFPVRP